MRAARSSITVVFVMASCYALVWSQPLAITVEPDTAYVINGVDQIPSAVFGVTAYEGAPWPADPQWQDVLADSGIACLGFPGDLIWVVDPDRKPWASEDEVWAWFESEAAADKITNGLLYGASYLYGQILPGLGRWYRARSYGGPAR